MNNSPSRPLWHRQAYDRWISTRVGDNRGIPSVECFCLLPLCSIAFFLDGNGTVMQQTWAHLESSDGAVSLSECE